MELEKRYRILLVIILFLGLVLVRAYENTLFYDPFIAYFEHDYLHKPIPVFSGRVLLLDMFLRYFLNSFLSLLIIYFAFMDRSFLIFSVKFYAIAFFVLITTFFVILKGELANGYLFAFYVRRFIIHPLFVLLLLPAFYYKRLNSREII